jgi:hypothetical protein
MYPNVYFGILTTNPSINQLTVSNYFPLYVVDASQREERTHNSLHSLLVQTSLVLGAIPQGQIVNLELKY